MTKERSGNQLVQYGIDLRAIVSERKGINIFALNVRNNLYSIQNIQRNYNKTILFINIYIIVSSFEEEFDCMEQ